ncbi:integrase, catalytic region, zinc finger, CCHC-type containing protein, partial [Tanacetum coccineum]
NGVVKRQNCTLVEAARTMLIFYKAMMFLWAEAVATAGYTQNRSLIHTRHDKTPYELVHDKKPDLTFFCVFGALCYPTNDSEDLGKLKAKADIGIFIGYAPNRKGYGIYNKRTRRIMETIHVQFNELTEQMAPVHISRGPVPILMTPGKISSGFFEPPSVERPVPHTLAVYVPVISAEPSFEEPSSKDVSSAESTQVIQPHNHLGKWSKDYPMDNVISNPSRLNFKTAMAEACWFKAMQEEIHKFDRLQVWELVPKPDYVMIIALKWIYKVKLDEYGDVLKNKARLVAKGYRQEEGIDLRNHLHQLHR